MTDFRNGLKVGDVITAARKGYWVILDFERQFQVKDSTTYTGIVATGKDEDEVVSKVKMSLLMDSTYKRAGKNPRVDWDWASECQKVSRETVEKGLKRVHQMLEGLEFLDIITR